MSPGENTGEQRWHHEKTPSSFGTAGSRCSRRFTDVSPQHPAAVPARRSRDADALLQHQRGPARPTAATAPSGHARTGGARCAGAPLPDGADPPGGEHRTVHRDPFAGPRGVRHLPAVAPGASREPRAIARHPGPHLLQVRRGQPGRLAQAEHRHPAGLLQPRGGRDQTRHGDRRRPVGKRTRLRRLTIRPGPEGLHGEDQLPAEAVSAKHDPGLRRLDRSISVA